MNVRRELERRLSRALQEVAGRADLPAMVSRAARAEFGDYQANGVMAAAKRLKANPRELAERVAAAADVADLAETPDVAGPGFLNIRLKDEWIGRAAAEARADERLGAAAPETPQTVVVDYSAPNLAKEMHVGHLRSTVIGDALARTLDFLGHRVVRQNHVGDWGTQFGMLTAYLDYLRARESGDDDAVRIVARIRDLEEFYRAARKECDANDAFRRVVGDYVVRLQKGDPRVLESWREYCKLSWAHFAAVYRRLGVLLTGPDRRGESFYGGIRRDESGQTCFVPEENLLPQVLGRLREKGLLTESEGAQCVFLDEFTDKDGKVIPVIVQKSDGGYLYATTDLAAIWFRCGKGRADGEVDWSADRILYVVDAGQSLHFRQVFAVARRAGLAPEGVSLEHVPFGVVRAPAGGKFRTREGGTVKLMDLLEEAVRRARELVEARNPDLPDAAKADVAEAVGVGAVKYADLAQNRTSDYVFSFEKMLSLDGNTAPYMQYACARIRSIFRTGGVDAGEIGPAGIVPAETPERALALKLVQFPETVEAVAAECLPNFLCAYLYELAGAFSGFYETCPVLKAPEPVRTTRLALCDLTARVIGKGLDLLGIRALEQM